MSFFKVDLEPSVAANLDQLVRNGDYNCETQSLPEQSKATVSLGEQLIRIKHGD